MPDVILTIGIPTYNRLAQLSKNLPKITQQCNKSGVEILISDNASQDGTQEFVEKYIKHTGIKIRYIRNKVNKGFDKNIISIYKHAKGKYIWFFSDDDEMLNGAINKMLGVIKKYKPTLIYPNQIDSNHDVLVNAGDFLDITPYMPTGIGFRIVTSKVFLLKDEIARLAIVRLSGFISCCVVQRNLTVLKEIQNINGGGMMQTAISSLSLKYKPYAFIMSKPLVRGNDKDYFSKWFMESSIFGIDALYSNPLLGYSKKIVRRLRLHTCMFALLILSQRKMLSVPIYYSLSKHEMMKIIRMYRRDSILLSPFLLLVLISSFIPTIVFKLFYRMLYLTGRQVSYILNLQKR